MSYRPTPKQALLLWRLIAAETEEEREPSASEVRPKLNRAERDALVDHGFIDLGKKPGRRGSFCSLTDKAWVWATDTLDVELLKSDSPVGAEALQGVLRRLLPYLQQHEVPLATIFSLQQSHSAEVSTQETTSRERKRTPNGPANHPRKSKRKVAAEVSPKPGRKSSRKVAAEASANGARKSSRKVAAKAPASGPRKSSRKATSATSANGVQSHRLTRASITPNVTRVADAIERACLDLTGGSRKQRVRLTALRKKLRAVNRVTLDATLLDLQDQGRLVLYRDDNTSALTAADHDAALIVGNAPRHLVYLEA